MRRRSIWTLAPIVLAFAGVARAQSLPSRLTDKELWQLTADISENGGSFRSDNFLSNETGFQYVIPDLLKRVKPGGVYLGVGPEQNFTYIVALQPKIAFIFDIRRGNMIEHLMYKALFEISADRADFLSKLFSRPRPSGLDSASTPQQLFEAYIAARPTGAVPRESRGDQGPSHQDARLRARRQRSAGLDYVYRAFFGGGPQINYNYPYGGAGFGRGGMPNYAS